MVMNNTNKYDRIFTFGCSWTHYIWPTWADMIRYTDQAPNVINWGKGGMGNVGIFYRMIECDLKNKFTENDLIIVQWSSWTREDRFIDKWEAYGNIFNTPYYGEEYIKKYWSWNNDVIKNSSCILAANRMFQIDYQFNMLPFLHTEFNTPVPKQDWHDLYFDVLPKLDSFPETYSCFNGILTWDAHPDIIDHLNFFNKNIKSKFGFTLEKNEPEILRIYDSIIKKLNNSLDRQAINELIHKECKIFDSAWPYSHEGS